MSKKRYSCTKRVCLNGRSAKPAVSDAISDPTWTSIMPDLRLNDFVNIPCEVRRGPFPTDHLVSIRVEGQEWSAYVRSDFIFERKGDKGYLLGRVSDISDEGTTVLLPSAFFTTQEGRPFANTRWVGAVLKLLRSSPPA